MSAKKKNKYVKFRHKVVFRILTPFISTYFKLKYNMKIDKYAGKNTDALIVANHVVTLDPLIMACSFKFPIYFIASDQIFNLGFVSKIIRYLVSPIPKMKGIADIETVKDAVRYSKGGGAIGLFPEGNRTFTGETCTIPPQIGKLIKLLKKPVIIMNFEGGFMSKPRFAKEVRRGAMRSTIKAEWNYEDYKDLSANEIYENLKKELYVNAYDVQRENPVEYKCKTPCEYIENVLYLCPKCHKLHTMKSYKTTCKCSECGYEITMNNYGFLECLSENETKFSTILEWFDWQNQYLIENVVTENYIDTPIISTVEASLFLDERAKKRTLIDHGKLHMYSDRFEFTGKENTVLNFDDINEVAVQTAGKFQIYTKGGVNYLLKTEANQCILSFNVLFHMIRNKKLDNGSTYIGI